MTKFIFVTGGVYSSLGKGITASSIGRILKQLGFSVIMQKLDPYLNIDPMFISPLQHGEVFITKDGAKADLDLGNYERFIDSDLNMYSTVTSGRIYSEVLSQERAGLYNGKTIQVIPHLTNQIISKLNKLAETSKADFAIVEIGGTVGDIESLPFIQAINEFGLLHKKDVLFAHCVPLILVASVVGELKTKPAQHSIKTLRSLGINPDILLLRSSEIIDSETRNKLSLLTAIPKENMYECMDLESTYFLPEELYNQKIYDCIFKHFGISKFKDNFNEWINFTNTIRSKKDKLLNIGIIGENVELHDAYFSVRSSLELASYKLGVNLNIEWIKISNLDCNKIDDFKLDGVIIAPAEDKDNFRRTSQLLKELENKSIPTLSYGKAFENVIINHLPNELFTNLYEKVFIKSDESVVGARSSEIKFDLSNIYGSSKISERHFHDYEFNKEFIEKIDKSLKLSGFNTNNKFLDFVQLDNHKFYFSTYANIEFTSRPNKPNLLYLEFLKACIKND